MPLLICLNCGVGFEGARTTRQFCSDNCRVKFNQKRKKETTEKAFRDVGNTQCIIPSNIPDPDKKFVGDEKYKPLPGITVDPFTEEEIRIGRAFMTLCAKKRVDPDEFLLYLDTVFIIPDPAKKAEKNEPSEEEKAFGSKYLAQRLQQKLGIKKGDY